MASALAQPLRVLQAALFSAALLLGPAVQPSAAVLNSPNAQIARSVDAALRRSIPAFNPSVAAIQKELEDVSYYLRIPQRKPWGNMASNVQDALSVVAKRDLLLEGVPPAQRAEGEQLAERIQEVLKRLELAVKTQQPDAVSIRVANVLAAVAELELLQAPGLPFRVPSAYQALPRLTGRAVVEFVVEKKDGALGFTDPAQGGPVREARLQLTLDGYSAPISAGNFLKNVQDGLYNGRPISVSYTSVYVQGKRDAPRPPVPLEILQAGEFDPVYRIPLDVQQGELPVLPLSISGAVTMAHLPDTDSFLSGDEWFIFKFDKQQAGLAGLAFDEGNFGVFGYVTTGLESVPRIENGDIIVSSRVVSGADRLVVPPAPATS